MIVPIDHDRFSQAGLQFIDGDPAASFIIPPEREGENPRTVKVMSDGANLHFAEHRSSAQRRVLAILGFAIE